MTDSPANRTASPQLTSEAFDAMIRWIRAGSVAGIIMIVFVLVHHSLPGNVPISALPQPEKAGTITELALYIVGSVATFFLSRIGTVLLMVPCFVTTVFLMFNPLNIAGIVVHFVLLLALYRSLVQCFRLHSLLKQARAQPGPTIDA